jgi:hypothetical protein
MRAALDETLLFCGFIFKAGVNNGWVSDEAFSVVIPGFAAVAFTAERHIHIGTSYQSVAVLWCGPKRETGILLAELANGR